MKIESNLKNTLAQVKKFVQSLRETRTNQREEYKEEHKSYPPFAVLLCWFIKLKI